MFVTGNKLSDVKGYFSSRLSEVFTLSEIHSIVKDVVINRLGISDSDYLLGTDLKFSESDLLHFREVVHRLLANEPYQHIVGEVHFYGLRLKSDKRALIPRPETEELVQWVLGSFDQANNIMDLCAGSGCIALALKSQLMNCNIVAAELSDDALDLINENKELTGLDVNVLKLDVLKPLTYNFEAKFDCWVSNPPYVLSSDKQQMSAHVLEHEPHMALFVEDDDPLIFYREIGKQAIRFLKPGGHLFFEIHEMLGESTMKLLDELGFVNIELRKDLQGKDRMVRAQTVNSPHESK